MIELNINKKYPMDKEEHWGLINCILNTARRIAGKEMVKPEDNPYSEDSIKKEYAVYYRELLNLETRNKMKKMKKDYAGYYKKLLHAERKIIKKECADYYRELLNEERG